MPTPRPSSNTAQGAGLEKDEDLMTPEVNVDALAESTIAHRVRDLEKTAEALAEDVSGAEFIAATEFAEDIGIEMEFQARLQRISSQQWQYVMEDYQQAMDELQSVRTPLGLFTLGLKHVNRRARHQQEGWLAFLQSWYIEQRKLADTHQQLTQPLVDLLVGKSSAE